MAKVNGSANVSSGIVDLSLRSAGETGLFGAICLPADKGSEEVTLISSPNQLLEEYTPDGTIKVGMSNAFYQAMAFLKQSNQLMVKRLSKNAKFSVLPIMSVSSDVDFVNIKQTIQDGTYSDLGSDNNIKIPLSLTEHLSKGNLAVLDNNNYFVSTLGNQLFFYNNSENARATDTQLLIESKDVGSNVQGDTVFLNQEKKQLLYSNNTFSVNNHGLSDDTMIRIKRDVNRVIELGSPSADIYTTNDGTNVIRHFLLSGQRVKVETSVPSTIDAIVEVIDSWKIKLKNTTGNTYISNGVNVIINRNYMAGDNVVAINLNNVEVSTITSNTLAGTGHGLQSGQTVIVDLNGSTSTGINSDVLYKIIKIDNNNFQLSIDGITPVTCTLTSGSIYIKQEFVYVKNSTSNSFKVSKTIDGSILNVPQFTEKLYMTLESNLNNGDLVFPYDKKMTTFTGKTYSSSNLIEVLNHGLKDGDAIYVLDESTSGLSESVYYVTNSTTNTFNLLSTYSNGDNNVIPTVFNITGDTDITFVTSWYGGVSVLVNQVIEKVFDEFKLNDGTSNIQSPDLGNSLVNIMLKSKFLEITLTDDTELQLHNFDNNTTSKINLTSNGNKLVSSSKINLANGTTIRLTSNKILPTGLSEFNTYYVIKYNNFLASSSINTSDNEIKLALSYEDAIEYSNTNDTSINIPISDDIILIHNSLGQVSSNVNSILNNIYIDDTTEQVYLSNYFASFILNGDKIKFINYKNTLPLPFSNNDELFIYKDVTDDGWYLSDTIENATSITPIPKDVLQNITQTFNTSQTKSQNIVVKPNADLELVQTGMKCKITISGGIYNLENEKEYFIHKTVGVTNTTLKLAKTLEDLKNGIFVDFSKVGTSPDEIQLSLQGTNKVELILNSSEVENITLGDNNVLLFTSKNVGKWGNSISILLEDYRSKESDAFIIKVFKSSNLTVPLEVFVASRKRKKDGNGRNIYINDVLLGSKYINAINNELIDENVFPLINGQINSLNYGTNGDIVTTGDFLLGVQEFRNYDTYPFTVILDGGYSVPAYQKEISDIAKGNDAVAILSTPYELEVASNYIDKLIEYRNVDLNLNTHNSALYTPSPLIYDKYNDRYIYVSPDGFVGGSISRTDRVDAIFQPVAGTVRGQLDVIDLRRRFTKSEMDRLYDAGINPLRFMQGQGIVIWGQKTLLNRPSALDRLNVVLLIAKLMPRVRLTLEPFLFQLNTPELREFATVLLEQIMQEYQDRNGLYDYKVIIDDTNNTANDIDNHLLNVTLLIKPAISIEYIGVTLGIASTGISFSLAEQLL